MPSLTESQLDTFISMPADVGTLSEVESQNAIVLRGYLEDTAFTRPSGAAGTIRKRRLYLSARRDVYVDFEAADALRIARYRATPGDGLDEAVTLWLATTPSVTAIPSDVSPRRYFISRELHAPTGFVSGELLEDFMESQESRTPAWPEQQYGSQGWPRTGAASGCH